MKKAVSEEKKIKYGNLLKIKMIKAGFKSQKELASAAKIPYANMRLIVCGKQWPRKEWRDQIRGALAAGV